MQSIVQILDVGTTDAEYVLYSLLSQHSYDVVNNPHFTAPTRLNALIICRQWGIHLTGLAQLRGLPLKGPIWPS
jgi:hypothetical protein